MNFLHYAIFMFVICSGVLIAVSLATPAPDRKKLAGLTFSTVEEKLDLQPIAQQAYKPVAESTFEHRINVALSLLLALSVIGLWIYFR